VHFGGWAGKDARQSFVRPKHVAGHQVVQRRKHAAGGAVMSISTLTRCSSMPSADT
jgi:hypothetical protein